MAVKRKAKSTRSSSSGRANKIAKVEKFEEVKPMVEPSLAKASDGEQEWGEPLDPQEEKVLDWILKGVVIFILGWLGLSILLVIGGYFGLWK